MTLRHPPKAANSIRHKASFIPQHVHKKTQTVNQSNSLGIKKMTTMLLHGTSEAEKVAQYGGSWNPGQN